MNIQAIQEMLGALRGQRQSYHEPGQGLDQGTIDHMPTTTYNENSSSGDDNTCTICQDEFKNGDEIRTLPCFHKFHKDCIDKWLDRSSVCPICKKDIRRGSN